MATAMATMTIRTDTSGVSALLCVIAECIDGWPENKAEAFAQEWRLLEAVGAQTADVGFADGVVYVWVSDDFKQHCRKWGIPV